MEVEEAEDPRRVRHRLCVSDFPRPHDGSNCLLTLNLLNQPFPTSHSVDEPREEFNTTMLAYFYRNLFPFRAMFRWLAYGNGARAFGGPRAGARCARD